MTQVEMTPSHISQEKSMWKLWSLVGTNLFPIIVSSLLPTCLLWIMLIEPSWVVVGGLMCDQSMGYRSLSMYIQQVKKSAVSTYWKLTNTASGEPEAGIAEPATGIYTHPSGQHLVIYLLIMQAWISLSLMRFWLVTTVVPLERGYPLYKWHFPMP